MPELNLKGDQVSPEEIYIREYIEKNNIVALPFPDALERETRGSVLLNIASLHDSIRLMRVAGVQKRDITEHFEIFAKAMMILERNEIEFELTHIYTSKAKIMTLPANMRDGRDIIDPKVNHVNNVIGRINIVKYENNQRNLAIGLGYDERGFTFCFGTNIFVCSNMSMFGEHYLTSYGPNKTKVSEIFEILEDWIKNAHKVWDSNNAILDKMIDTYPTYADYAYLLGDIMIKAAKGYPVISSTHINALVKAFVNKEIAKGDDDLRTSLYEFYNMGTFILTHQDNHTNVWKDLQAFGDYIVEHFKLV